MSRSVEYEPSRYHAINLGQYFDSYVAEANELMEKVLLATKTLPKVDENGHSECPSAENLYAQKEEMEEKLRSMLRTHSGLTSVIDKELSRMKEDMGTIYTKRNALRTRPPKDKYDEAGYESLQAYDKVVKQKKRLLSLLRKMQSVIDEVSKVKFPGKKPQRSFAVALGTRANPARADAGQFMKGASVTPPTVSSRSSLRGGMSSLLAMGPLGGARSPGASGL
ncbi:hypothetical protein ACFL1X_01505 [Candidatus Hydrogenedentota bacterium]